MVKKTKWHSWSTGRLAKGCRLCVQGRKLVLFITGLCGQRCFYCPVSEHKFGRDVVYANEWQVSAPDNPVELIKEAELTGARGAGITGGDPLVNVDRCVAYIKLLKERFGRKFHIHLYTPLRLVTLERLQKLHDAGLDEIRFHPNLDDDSLWERMSLARRFDWDIGVEIPVIPGYEQKTKKLIDFVGGEVDFLNLNELELSDTTAGHYQLHVRGFKPRDELSYGAMGSRELAMILLDYASRKGIATHFCTAKLKDAVQLRNRIKLRAKSVALKTDIVTKEGTLVRGCAYLPELAPGTGYHEALQKADKKSALEKLNKMQEKARGIGVKTVLDDKKLRLLLSAKTIRKEAKKLKGIGLLPAIVEEYPTADALEVEVEFV
ncbi:MAG: radical SAM protein [Candidatus Woesearchaeota archaeon]